MTHNAFASQESPQPLTSNPARANPEIHRPVPVSVSQPVQQMPVQQPPPSQQQPVTVIKSQQQPAFLQSKIAVYPLPHNAAFQCCKDI